MNKAHRIIETGHVVNPDFGIVVDYAYNKRNEVIPYWNKSGKPIQCNSMNDFDWQVIKIHCRELERKLPATVKQISETVEMLKDFGIDANIRDFARVPTVMELDSWRRRKIDEWRKSI